MATSRPGVRTLRDVANAAGVSVATASRVLAGNSTVNPAMRANVIQAAAHLGFRVNPAARATASGLNTIACYVADKGQDPYSSAIVRGLVEAAAERGFLVTVSGAKTSDALVTTVRSLVVLRPTAIIVGARDAGVEALAADRVVNRFRSEGGGFAMVGAGSEWAPSVSLDTSAGAESLIAALHERGYRRILAIGVPARYPSLAARLSDIMSAVTAQPVIADGITRDDGYQAMRRTLAEGIGTADAVVAVTDMLAIGAMAALRDAGILPGRDIGVAGFDDVQPARDVVPSLTSVNTHLVQAGKLALPMALGEVPDQALTASVVLRDSTPYR